MVQIPRRNVVHRLVDKLSVAMASVAFAGPSAYWELRYRLCGSSGAGSYGPTACFKANFVNRFIAHHNVRSVIDFGCGDGAQLHLLKCAEYIGVDVSRTAAARCRRRFARDPTKRFLALSDFTGETADAALSLDVIYHLVHDEVFFAYLDRLFSAARSFVVIFSTDHDDAVVSGSSPHVRNRELTALCRQRYPRFMLIERGSPHADGAVSAARFLVFKRHGA